MSSSLRGFGVAGPFPHLWMLSAGRTEQLLRGYDFAPYGSLPAGFYRRSEADAISLVVIRDLPRSRDTLLLRLMGEGTVLKEALAELAQLPEGAREQQVTLASLVAFRIQISHDPTDEERTFLMSTQSLYDQWEMQIRHQGRQEGLQEGLQTILLEQLRTRFGVLPEATVARVTAAGSEELSLWARRVLSAPALDDIFRDP